MTVNLFSKRHIGSDSTQQQSLLKELGYTCLTSFIKDVIPADLLSLRGTTEAPELPEHIALANLKKIAHKNTVLKNLIGLGYYDTVTPSVIKRNVFENPGWYTAYTPYQAEIAQGRLEALMNFQQMIMDLTGFDLANASLLDEATAAAEAMSMAKRLNPNASSRYFVDQHVFPQTLAVIKTRAHYLNIEVNVGDIASIEAHDYFGVFIQNPDVFGTLKDHSETITSIKAINPQCIVTLACDILSLVLFKSPKAMHADIAIGSTQRFGIPLGFGGPAAAYMATFERNKRTLPGRVIGLSVDSKGKAAYRMALQTREQHIRREKATSNICTSQVLLANMAGFYAAYHGPLGLTAIAQHCHQLATVLAINLQALGITLVNGPEALFDTVACRVKDPLAMQEKFQANGYAIGLYQDTLLLSIGESLCLEDIATIIHLLTDHTLSLDSLLTTSKTQHLRRTDAILTHPVFNSHHSETQMLRYLKRLENKDISLTHSMIPLGSCTMKLNAACQLEALSWPEFANIHPFAPKDTVQGYLELTFALKQQLMAITGFSAVSLQPNSGAQGEYAGILAIRRYQASIGQGARNICLIPKSAHGTNPATAQMMGLEVIVVACDEQGNVDLTDLQQKCALYQTTLCCLMITYPSTHGVFESNIKTICQAVHDVGGQVYMDGANLNAMVGLVKPAELGADVSHINLHKTFAIPHGGGGPGMGPIGVKAHLAPFLPEHSVFDDEPSAISVSAAPFGSASILLISYMYISLLGEAGIKHASQVAILNANYIAFKLKDFYPILYTGQNQFVAHECIIDLRPLKNETGISEVDIAKRLMDYGFHAPTMSFPVTGTLMIEPTESEDKTQIDLFLSAMINIYHEVQNVKTGAFDKVQNPLKNAPHTLADIRAWDKPYSIELGCFPLETLKDSKIFPSVNRIDDAMGDRNFLCSCS